METHEPLLSPTSEEALHGLAYQAYRGGDYRSAVPLYKLLTGIAHRNMAYWRGLAASLQMMKEYREALAAYGYLALHDDDPYVWYHAAECHHGLCDRDKACAALDKAIAMARRSAQHHAFAKQLTLLRRRWRAGDAD